MDKLAVDDLQLGLDLAGSVLGVIDIEQRFRRPVGQFEYDGIEQIIARPEEVMRGERIFGAADGLLKR